MNVLVSLSVAVIVKFEVPAAVGVPERFVIYDEDDTRRLMARDPENALWLFLDWLTVCFVIFSCTHAMSHCMQVLINYYHGSDFLWYLRRMFGGFDSTIYVVIAAITLFFHRVQRLYRRMEEDHHHLEETSHEILALNREMEALVMERTMAEMALGMAHGIRNPLHVAEAATPRGEQLLAKAQAVANPAGPPPTTRTSQESMLPPSAAAPGVEMGPRPREIVVMLVGKDHLEELEVSGGERRDGAGDRVEPSD